MNDQDWLKKFRRQPGGGCTLLLLPLLVLLVAPVLVALGAGALSPP
ncbi:hypothetical protein L6R53_13890 [Myxococcota bacterium]|nr:hypothetical protein [Myxococcota bacterium]